jgi:hypothetical protein
MPGSDLPHLFVSGFLKTTVYRAPGSGPRLPALARNRQTHGERLMRELQRLQASAESLRERRQALEIPHEAGFAIAVEIRPKGALLPATLEWSRDGIEVLSFVDAIDKDVLVLHVPEGRIGAFERRVQDYLNKDTKSGNPANMALVNAIERFRGAAFNDLWADTVPPPLGDRLEWFQVWLRAKALPAQQVYDEFVTLAARLQIQVEPGYVVFPGRVVVAVFATRVGLEGAAELLDRVAEFRGVSTTATFFLSHLSPAGQGEWVREMQARISMRDDAARTRVALLDTGVNQAHPLLGGVLARSDMYAYDPAWGQADDEGHGTEMAGIAAFGNLTAALESNDPIELAHMLESVKILPPGGANSPHLYGTIVKRAAELVENAVPAGRRVYAMMTTAIGDTNGEPSEWSAAIDQLAFGRPALEIGVTGANPLLSNTAGNRLQRLFVMAGGNLPWTEWPNYPNSNAIRGIESPAQAWNVLTVGACTSLTEIDSAIYPNSDAIAPMGGLSPSSRTSVIWSKSWPHKPDVVAEGGNASLDGTGGASVGPDSLRLLTTSRTFLQALLCETGDTSAATAEVARLAALIWSQYPDYWPETVRALIVHGARHTASMRASLPIQPTQQDKRNLLRTVGYGLVQSSYSMLSTEQRPTLVLQETLRPYRRDSTVKMGHVNIHELPWPKDALLEVLEGQAQLRVTLSYFVEPNPGKRGWTSKFRYPSYGLRFALKGASETEEEFLQRVNMLERDEEDDESHSDPDRAGWTFGANLRTRGSIHSDVWTGTPAALAAKGEIAIYPVGGWWKDWKEANQWGTEIRYSLVLSLELAESSEVDIYHPIETLIPIPVPVPIDL